MFITNMAQYALFGYSVGALDFVMKPVNYYTFAMKVRRVLKRVQKKESAQRVVVLNLTDGLKKIETKQIYFVEIQNRLLHYYTTEGEYVVKGTMQSAEKMLEADTFLKCNHWYLVNLRHVKEVKKNIVVVGTHELEISRRNKTMFLKALTDYLGENI
ncbi:LytR/AlgR family response regulator transcription factor [Mediterraneibacter agrestimuris]|uniref:LytR/AlgR family response regulator transcription factor n=1 Tax=Mediterraneibacter agrestimuris TaxID=2941333 RepID=UPI00203AABB6|nr:LytTR family transcriptional regulator DNA-binding domain-containing protein [Mediterraneibacter agrestimuris]